MNSARTIKRIPLTPSPLVIEGEVVEKGKALEVLGAIAHASRPVKKKRRPIARHLDKTRGWAREMTNNYRDVRDGRIDSHEAARQIYIAREAARAVKDAELVDVLRDVSVELRRIGIQPDKLNAYLEAE